MDDYRYIQQGPDLICRTRDLASKGRKSPSYRRVLRSNPAPMKPSAEDLRRMHIGVFDCTNRYPQDETARASIAPMHVGNEPDKSSTLGTLQKEFHVACTYAEPIGFPHARCIRRLPPVMMPNDDVGTIFPVPPRCTRSARGIQIFGRK